MPEIAEVEVIRLGLKNYLPGQKILQVEVLAPKLIAGRGTKRVDSLELARQFEVDLTNKVVESIIRRGKNLIFNFNGESALVIHLKMTGQLVYKSSTGQVEVSGGHPIESSTFNLPNKHTYIIFTLENGVLYFNDIRKFGYAIYFPEKNQAFSQHFIGLGVEPLSPEFTKKYFYEQLKKKKGFLKTVLLDQKIVAGLGNIYVDECCFEAKILPFRKIETLTKKEIESLHKAILKIIPLAIKEGGSSVANYLLADGSRGNYAIYHKVYGRSKKPCLVCSKTLHSQKITGRTTVYCTFCQK